MTTTHDQSLTRSDQRLRTISMALALLALIVAIPLCVILAVLIKIAILATRSDPSPSQVLSLPITGWQALVLQQGPVALIVLALLSLLLEVFRRWKRKVSKAEMAAVPSLSEVPPMEAVVPSSAAPLPAPARKPGRWRSPISLAVVSLLLAGLMLLALAPLSGAVFDTGGNTYLDSVAMVSPSEGWAVGAFAKNVGGYAGVIWHYQHGRWTQVTSPTSAFLEGVWMFPTGEGWAVGDQGTILHEHAGRWAQVTSGTTQDINSVAMGSPTQGWAVGGKPGSLGSLASSAPTAEGLAVLAQMPRYLRLHEVSPRDEQDTCVILQYTNGRWTPVFCPGNDILTSVSVLADGEAWAVGWSGNILHEDQGKWVQVPSPTKNGLNSVSMLSPTEGWAVGDNDTILHYLNGQWSVLPANSYVSLSGVAVSSPADGWIVGDGGVILHLSQEGWNVVSSPKGIQSGDPLFAVTLLPGGQEGWAVGADQLILHLRNGIWNLYSQQASG